MWKKEKSEFSFLASLLQNFIWLYIPFVFVYSPSLLLITGEFQTNQLIITLIGTLVGIALIGIAFSGYWFRPLKKYEQILIGLGSLFFVAPGMGSMLFGSIIILPMIFLQFYKKN